MCHARRLSRPGAMHCKATQLGHVTGHQIDLADEVTQH